LLGLLILNVFMPLSFQFIQMIFAIVEFYICIMCFSVWLFHYLSVYKLPLFSFDLLVGHRSIYFVKLFQLIFHLLLVGWNKRLTWLDLVWKCVQAGFAAMICTTEFAATANLHCRKPHVRKYNLCCLHLHF
jgi:hypothetical protein